VLGIGTLRSTVAGGRKAAYGPIRETLPKETGPTDGSNCQKTMLEAVIMATATRGLSEEYAPASLVPLQNAGRL